MKPEKLIAGATLPGREIAKAMLVVPLCANQPTTIRPGWTSSRPGSRSKNASSALKLCTSVS
jgi:hypothetical protein